MLVPSARWFLCTTMLRYADAPSAQLPPITFGFGVFPERVLVRWFVCFRFLASGNGLWWTFESVARTHSTPIVVVNVRFFAGIRSIYKAVHVTSSLER